MERTITFIPGQLFQVNLKDRYLAVDPIDWSAWVQGPDDCVVMYLREMRLSDVPYPEDWDGYVEKFAQCLLEDRLLYISVDALKCRLQTP